MSQDRFVHETFLSHRRKKIKALMSTECKLNRKDMMYDIVYYQLICCRQAYMQAYMNHFGGFVGIFKKTTIF